MATHGIGKLKFNLSKQGLAWRFGDGETHRLFGRAKGEGDGSEYEENMTSEDEPGYQDDYDAQDEGYADDGDEYGGEELRLFLLFVVFGACHAAVLSIVGARRPIVVRSYPSTCCGPLRRNRADRGFRTSCRRRALRSR